MMAMAEVAPAPSTRARWLVPAAIWLGIALALTALWLSGQAGEAWQAARDARLAPLALAVALGVLLPAIHAARWRHVMARLGTPLPHRLATDITVSASLVNYASPGYLGAPAKAFLANRSAGAPWSRSLLAMAFEQGLDFLMLALATCVALLLAGPAAWDALLPGRGRAVELALLALGIVGVVLLAVAAQGRVRRIVGRIAEAFRELWGIVDRRLVLLLTLVYWLAQLAVVALLLWALRLPVEPRAALLLATLPLLAGQVVPLPGGLGAREATIVALAGTTGIATSALLALAVLQRVLLVAALPLALALLRLRLPRNTRQGANS